MLKKEIFDSLLTFEMLSLGQCNNYLPTKSMALLFGMRDQFNFIHVISGGAAIRKGNTSVPIPRLT